MLTTYLHERGLEYVAMIEPDDFVRWVFPRLFNARIPRYENIANTYGYTITTNDLWQIQSEQDFLALIENALSK